MEMKRHVKLYKSGKVWLAAAIFVVGVGAGVVNVPTISATPQIVRAATNDLVMTKDANGNLSIDPTNTAGSAVAITPSNAADYFTATSKAGITRTITGNTVQLTTGHESEDNVYADGIVLMLANQQIDFKSDFSLNLTMNINYDSTMGGWVPGDGTALFFQPLDAATSLSKAGTGSDLGLVGNYVVANKSVVSFNISSNAMGWVKYGTTTYPKKQWIIYESNAAPLVAIDTPIVSGVAIGQNGSISYTYDMKYTASTRTLTTVVRDRDSNSDPLQTWTFQVPDTWSDTGYTMGVSASTAGSHGAYQAVLNGYSYTPAGTTMSIKSTGLPAGTTGYDQSNIAAIAGNVVAFYPEGTTAPTTDASGQPVTTAIAVPAVGDYVLKQPQFLTVATDDSKNVATLAFAKPSTVKVKYVDQNSKEIQSATTQSGYVGDQYSVTAPDISGYTYSKVADGSADLNGKYTDDSQTVTLEYNKKESTVSKPTESGDLTIKYVDQNSKEIQESNVKKGYVGNVYGVTPSEINGYTYQGLGKDSAALTGKFTADDQTITLTYQQNRGEEVTPTTAGDLTIKYVDQNGKEIQEPNVKNGYVGNAYGVTPSTIVGYTYQGLGTDSAALAGQFTANAQTITLVYQQNHGEETTPTAAGDLTIKYVDQNGKSIQADTVKNGYVGNSYGVTPSTIGGYTYQGLGTGSAALNGKFTAGAQTITLVYQQNHGEETTPTNAGALTIKYVDQNGKSIQADTVKSGYVGNGYGITPSTIGGYTYQGLGTDSAALTGKFTTGAQTITLVYQQNHGEETTPTTAGNLT
ncbi:MucBP domain-containing protein, partial [Lacticaseibacillus porcinae]|uniref:MucBP domain-containing protein n=1 Tax=Lacticaseibacillus porcinae TaxID=1123687 RepID=UPI0017849875